ncbi:hypothetical protein OHB41_09145 [Streptomyces sp. NBC_01571]|uniref:hypothetical protein n=1 Tax=Streptomyces sp. NBC_01571 TaxID=2975883 RepID=UPI00225C0BFA|nr:hypothetical protein [Streptomyces sp. NBC_01571]MCX4573344.1 hypothetical protein [Streptomyces sp. NBC_01571]
MSAQLAATWVRIGDQWVRADRIVGVRLEPAAGTALGGRWAEAPSQRLLVCTTLPAEKNSGKGMWQEAAVCVQERGEVVAGTLLDAMNTTKSPAGSSRYVYPARTTEGRVSHWQASTTLPQGRVSHWQASTTLPQGHALTGGPKAVPTISGTPLAPPGALLDLIG